MSTQYSARAEWEPLRAARVHAPGLETWGGSLDPESNLFEAPLPPDQARADHERYVETLESVGVTVHHLAEDLAAGGTLEELVRDRISVTGEVDLAATLEALNPREKLQLGLARAEIRDDGSGPATVSLRSPISNIYFQRDTTILGDRGPILCRMASPVRQPERDVVRAAWAAIDAPVVHDVSSGPVEGGDFIPAGEFALLGVSGIVDGEEQVVRTSLAAGREILDAGALGFDQVGLVRAPIETEQALRTQHRGPSRMMHLLGWFNIAAEGLAVTFPRMARAATVEVYERTGDDRTGEGYERVAEPSLWTFLAEKGFDVVEADWSERWPTNFVAVDDGEVVPLYEPDEDGAYRPELNPTIEALKARGVTVHPSGEGLPDGPLTNGAGGFHCMTTPVRRGLPS